MRAAGSEESKDCQARRKARDKSKARARRNDTIGHLGPEAVAAFVDGEMEDKFMHRVRVHLVHCPQCRADVHAQRHASERLRHSNIDGDVRMPTGLMAKLADIASLPPREHRAPKEAAGETPAGEVHRDFLDRVEMVIRAIRHNQRGG
ncbi:anti-sigma factor [Corynebacterium sp.]|uniref:anti-sigma factor family protein n=1 Tax=Corynebacterium sp. TaxID=1720 RepID=UPI0026DB1055|nr:zf-HC2 domain-containing protein [Corynebacterium sp.]MDO5032015.1 zf-HC2 domain-containing protein [Corynebacterium sp.]